MTGQQIVDNCAHIAAQQFPERDLMGLYARALCEIGLLRTKVLELSTRLERLQQISTLELQELMSLRQPGSPA